MTHRFLMHRSQRSTSVRKGVHGHPLFAQVREDRDRVIGTTRHQAPPYSDDRHRGSIGTGLVPEQETHADGARRAGAVLTHSVAFSPHRCALGELSIRRPRRCLRVLQREFWARRAHRHRWLFFSTGRPPMVPTSPPSPLPAPLAVLPADPVVAGHRVGLVFVPTCQRSSSAR